MKIQNINYFRFNVLAFFLLAHSVYAGNTSSRPSAEPFKTRAEMSDREIHDFFVKLAKPAQQKMHWYRWGEGEYERDRINSRPAFQVESINFGRAYAGLGLYAAGNPVSSARYGIPCDEPEIVRITAPKGTLLLDLMDCDVQEKMEERNLTERDVYESNPPVMVKFTYDWWVLKSAEGVKIKDYSGKYIPTKDLLMHEKELLSGWYSRVSPSHQEKISPTLSRRLYRGNVPEVIPNPKSACEPCDPNKVKNFEAMQKVAEYYWRYDGTCGRYAIQDRNITLLEDQADPDQCRTKFPTVVLDNGIEVVKDEPRIKLPRDPKNPRMRDSELSDLESLLLQI